MNLGAEEVSVAEIREYPRINAEVARLLNLGGSRVFLRGVGGQRLLLAGLRGDWSATVELDGFAGPELAAELDAPNLKVVCRGSAADGAGRGMKAGELFILGGAGDAIGLGQIGGLIAVAGPVGDRAGLRQRGGLLILLDDVGRLAGERMSGGLLLAIAGRIGPFAGLARVGGTLALPESQSADSIENLGDNLDPNDSRRLRAVVDEMRRLRAEGGDRG